jgi:hypothetical protein
MSNPEDLKEGTASVSFEPAGLFVWNVSSLGSSDSLFSFPSNVFVMV